MPSFIDTDFSVFSETSAMSPERDLDRVRLRDRLAELHQEIYPDMRLRRWDLHPHWVPRFLISSARVEPPHMRIDFLLLRYSKPETTVRLMKKELGEDFSHPYSTLLQGVRLDEHGLSIEMLLTHKAWADAENLKNKLIQGPPEKRHLRQLLAELGGDFVLSIESATHQELARVRCSRLVNLGVLNTTLEKFMPHTHGLRIAICYPPGDPRLSADALSAEVLLRFGQLYLLYQFVNWSPRNDFLSRHRLARRAHRSAAAEVEAEDDAQTPRTESSS